MIQKVFNWLIQPLGRVALLIAALAALSAVVWGVNLTQATPAQPIEFPHTRHVAMGIQCLYCHPGATRGPSAGLPTPSKCWGCHQQLAITKTSTLLPPLVQAIEKGTPLQWVPVAQVPDFVQFNHRPHLADGLNCENCHGDVAHMNVYENPQVLNMGWCLNCHRARTEDNSQNNPNNDPAVSATLMEKRIKLTDCGTCHY
jgi:hypothetical protein